MSDFIENEELDEEEYEETENYITLTDDNGEEISFEVLGTVEYQERVFAVLLPFDDEDGEVIILEIVPDEESEEGAFISVDDEELLNAVFEQFRSDYSGEYDFE